MAVFGNKLMFCTSVLAIILLASVARGGGLPAIDEAVARKSWAVTGDSMRFSEFWRKLERGDKVTFGVIGGSITEGAGASSGATTWGAVVATGLRARFPQASIDFINAGIGATGSDIGAFRIRRDLLSSNPDLVGIEFSVNDKATEFYAETYEGCLRQVLRDLPQTAVLALGMTDLNGVNAQSVHARVCAHYQVPFVSYRDVVWPLLVGGRLSWGDISPDTVHPNDSGHAFAANLVLARLDKAYEEWKFAGRPAYGNSLLPDALYGTRYEAGEFIRMKEAKVLRNNGFSVRTDSYWGEGLACSSAGGRIAFEVTGATVAFLYRCGMEWGRIRVTVDGNVVLEAFDCYADVNWWWTPSVFIVRDQPGTHVIEIETLNDKSAGSTGYGCNLSGLLVSDSSAIADRWNWFKTRLDEYGDGESPEGGRGAENAIWRFSDPADSNMVVVCEREYRKALDCSLKGRLGLVASKTSGGGALSEVELSVEHLDTADSDEDRLAWRPMAMSPDDRAGFCVGYWEGTPSFFGYAAGGWVALSAEGVTPRLPCRLDWRVTMRSAGSGLSVSYAVKVNGAYAVLRDANGTDSFPCGGLGKTWDTVQFAGDGDVGFVGAERHSGFVIILK